MLALTAYLSMARPARPHSLRAVPRAAARTPRPSLALFGNGNLRVERPTVEDMNVIQSRQLGHNVSSVAGCGARCKHGFPQAFAYDPMERAPLILNGKVSGRQSRIESGLFRLSCPLLVKAIDEWEREGAVVAINGELRASAEAATDDPSKPTLAQMLQAAHEEHAAARAELIGDRLPRLLADAAADGAEQERIVSMVLTSGIAGQTRTKLDIKCVHAQLADHLCRSESNGVAEMLLRRLEARGTAVRGDDVCRAQCDLGIPESEARGRWWYEPVKNKWKLRKQKHRRKELMAEAKAEKQKATATEQ